MDPRSEPQEPLDSGRGLDSELRKTIVQMIYDAQEGHIPSAFSIVDILQVLYDRFLRFDPKNPRWEGRDVFVLSKGHGCAALYAVLAKHGFLRQADLDAYSTYDGILGGHPDRTKVPGVEASTGSLGHGLPFSLGIALGFKIRGRPNRVYTLVGDGECNEGTIWESAMVAHNLQLSNLCCIVDVNGSSARILPLPDVAQQFAANGWEVREIDGHHPVEIAGAFAHFGARQSSRPLVVVAHTVKGMGVSFLTHGVWHHKAPNREEYEAILRELAS